MKSLEFYFDYLSPYAYFAWNKVEKFCLEHKVALEARPVVFGKLLDHWGHLGPAEIPPKREWLMKYSLYYAHVNNLPLSFPKYHPFNSLPALRASLVSVSGKFQKQLIGEIFNAGWGQGKDIGDVNVICDVALKIGLDIDRLKEEIVSDECKSELKLITAEAISKGVFGIPTIIYDNQLFWGNDQFDYVSSVITQSYQVDNVVVSEIVNRPRAIDRKKIEDV